VFWTNAKAKAKAKAKALAYSGKYWSIFNQ
jgi:hypothetical protein